MDSDLNIQQRIALRRSLYKVQYTDSCGRRVTLHVPSSDEVHEVCQNIILNYNSDILVTHDGKTMFKLCARIDVDINVNWSQEGF